MKRFRNLLAILTIGIIGMTSCSKTGDTGPAGPVGPAGPASVYSSKWITLNMVGSFNGTDSVWSQTINAASITKPILDSGIILTYVNDGSDDVVPFSYFSASSWDVFSVGQVDVNSFVDLSGYLYRYVTIPGQLVQGSSAERKYKGYSAQELQAMPFAKIQQVIADKN